MAGRKPDREKRRWERLPLAIPVFVRGINGQGKEFVEFTTALNVSAGGVLLAIRQNLTRSSLVSLEIPSAPLPRAPVLPNFVRTVQARLIRVAYSNGCNVCGLRFPRPIRS